MGDSPTMRARRSRCLHLVGVLAVVLSGLAATAVGAESGIVTPVLEAAGLRFEPVAEAERWRLHVSGPGFYLRREFSGPGLSLSLVGREDSPPPDGSYLWELRALGRDRRTTGAVQSGSFRIRSGAILLPDNSQPEPAHGPVVAQPVTRVLDHIGPFYIDGPLAFGLEIDGTEAVGFLSMLVEEDNIRLVFRDTSVTAAFPTNDWQFTFNDSSNGGDEYFAIEDVTDSNSTPFRIDAGAGDDAVHIDQNGRVGIGISAPGALLHVDGDTLLDGDLSVLSSRAAKEGFAPVDVSALLERVSRLPLLEWSYLGDGEARHLGPTAEEFRAAFLLGRDERSINPLDLAGVALAAIQGLRSEVVELEDRAATTLRLLRERDQEISRLQSDREDLRRRIETLEGIVGALAASAGEAAATTP